MQSGSSDKRIVFWLLFVTFSLTLPVLFYMVQLIEVMPFAAILVMAFRNVVAMAATPGASLLWPIIFAIHIAVFGPLLWLLSKAATSLALRAQNRAVRCISTGSIVLGAVAIAWLSPYGMGGHGANQSLSWAKTFEPA